MQAKIKVDGYSGRLDKFLSEKFRENSRSYWQNAISSAFVLVNGQSATSNQAIKDGDLITINIPKAKTKQIKIPIIYEDQDCIVLNKPAGVLTHSKGEFNPEPTVATWLQAHIPHSSFFVHHSPSTRAGIVHRLDRGTSGVIICAKNEPVQKWLQKQFSTRKVEKTYIAVVPSKLEPTEAIIDLPIGRNPKKPQTFKVMPNGKPAQTHYKVLNEGSSYSLLELKPKTGRTHQLRVHLAYLKAPILGDELYGGKKYKRLMLHALALKIKLPSGEEKSFTAKLPQDFNEFK